LLRRIKKDVAKDLPPKTELHIKVRLTGAQRDLYKTILTGGSVDKGNSISHYKNLLMQLRKCCNHPYLFDNQEPEGLPDFGQHIIDASAKLRFVDKLLVKQHKLKNQILIFT